MSKPDLDLLRESLESDQAQLRELTDTVARYATDADEVLRRLLPIVSGMNRIMLELCRKVGDTSK